MLLDDSMGWKGCWGFDVDSRISKLFCMLSYEMQELSISLVYCVVSEIALLCIVRVAVERIPMSSAAM